MFVFFNSVATMGSLDDECEIENVTKECLEYGEALDELQDLIESTSSPDFAAMELASQVRPLKLQPPLDPLTVLCLAIPARW